MDLAQPQLNAPQGDAREADNPRAAIEEAFSELSEGSTVLGSGANELHAEGFSLLSAHRTDCTWRPTLSELADPDATRHLTHYTLPQTRQAKRKKIAGVGMSTVVDDVDPENSVSNIGSPGPAPPPQQQQKKQPVDEVLVLDPPPPIPVASLLRLQLKHLCGSFSSLQGCRWPPAQPLSCLDCQALL
mmetsp:Transcript_27934/g.43583  ORF Transcript_27934/g.43583 Transcript_27934/m.43583 type:complete len:187 (+) Transcript_27934:539-1099(+)